MIVSEADLSESLFDISFSRNIEASLLIPVPSPGQVFAFVSRDNRLVPVYGAWYLRLMPPLSRLHSIILTEDTPESELFDMFMLFETSACRLNPAEKCRLTSLAMNVCGDIGRTASLMKRIDLPDSKRSIQLCIDIAGLPESRLELLAQGRITLKTAGALLRADASSEHMLFTLFSKAHFTSRQQSILLEGIEDLMKRGTGYERLNEAYGGDELLEHKEYSQKEKGERVMQALDSLLFPHYSEDEAEYRNLVKELSLSATVKAEPSPYFEDGSVDFSFQAGSEEEFDRKMDILKKARKQKGFGRLFSF